MEPFVNVLIGFQIGIQVIGAYFVLKIIRMRSTPNLPYVLIFSALIFMGIVRADNILYFLNPLVRYGIQTLISILLMVGFASIYLLIKKR